MNWTDPADLERLHEEDTDAYRVGARWNFTIDRFGADFLITARGTEDAAAVESSLHDWIRANGLTCDRVFLRRMAADGRASQRPVQIFGTTHAEAMGLAKERGMRFEIDFAAGQSPGLFFDQRENRRFLQSLAPKRVLNAFAYTCAFSVAAALTGAETLSIDLSKKWLQRGRKNFELNGLSGTNPEPKPAPLSRFLADDVRDVLPRLRRRGERFDAILLDPPTHAKTPGRDFQVERELGELASIAAECLTPGGHLFLSTNYTRWSIADIEALGRAAAHHIGCDVRVKDVPLPPDIPPEELPATGWFQMIARPIPR